MSYDRAVRVRGELELDPGLLHPALGRAGIGAEGAGDLGDGPFEDVVEDERREARAA